jgi:hypothetical protein
MLRADWQKPPSPSDFSNNHLQRQGNQTILNIEDNFAADMRSFGIFGLVDKGVSACEDDGEHPHRHHCGEIEGGDPGNDAPRLPKRVTIDPGSGVLSDPTFEKLRRSRDELHDFHTALDFALGVRKGGARPPVATVARSYKRLPFVIDRLGGER